MPCSGCSAVFGVNSDSKELGLISELVSGILNLPSLVPVMHLGARGQEEQTTNGMEIFKSFLAIGLFLYLLKTSENV